MKRIGRKKNGHDNPPPEGQTSAPRLSEAAPYAAAWRLERSHLGVLIGLSAAVLDVAFGVPLGEGVHKEAMGRITRSKHRPVGVLRR